MSADAGKLAMIDRFMGILAAKLTSLAGCSRSARALFCKELVLLVSSITALHRQAIRSGKGDIGQTKMYQSPWGRAGGRVCGEMQDAEYKQPEGCGA